MDKHINLRALCQEVATHGPKNWRPGLLEELMAELKVEADKNLTRGNIAYSQRNSELLGRASRSDAVLKGGFFVGGPNGSAIVYNKDHIEPVIKVLCELTGEDNEDYTATSLDNPQVA